MVCVNLVEAPEEPHRMIVASNFLPINAKKDEISGTWCFSYDEDSIFWQLRAGLSADTDVFYVGSLKVNVHECEQKKVSDYLLENFKCVPTFIPSDIQKQFCDGFCKQYLWPLLHNMLPMYPGYCDRFNESLWEAYVTANMIFADKVMEVINEENDSVWVHDYHLMVLPTFLRKKYNHVKLGFFLHNPFPSSEVYRTLPVREEILKGLLNTDLIGFHTYDYARHFLSCCRRVLGLESKTNRGYLGLDYLGRTISIKILPAGIHMGRIKSALSHPSCSFTVIEICKQLKGKKLILSVDDMDIFKGINLKLLAIEQLLQNYPELSGKLVLVQILNPPWSAGKDVEAVMKEVYTTAKMINEKFSVPGYTPVIIIDHHVSFYEKAAFYTLAECCIVNAVRDGMNLIPYKYIACRQGSAETDHALESFSNTPRTRTSVVVVSEFIGCSPSLSGAIRVNPWDIDAVAEALKLAITMDDTQKQDQHEKHYQYVSSHDVACWARFFEQDLELSCKDNFMKDCCKTGLGLDCRTLSFSPGFQKLSTNQIVSAYKRAKCRAIFLDYDGTIVPQVSIVKSPSREVVSVLNNLCRDPNNSVFIVSGRRRSSLGEWFDQCENLGIAAEHGYFTRWVKDSSWEIMSHPGTDFTWKKIVKPVMQSYTEATDGSYIETKESALVWHYYNADPDFGSLQARELLDHLEDILANEPVVVKHGQHIVEVKVQGITKGLVVQQVLSTLTMTGKSADFILCIGDDRSDEDMFESILDRSSGAASSSETKIFACTVGQKPSKAGYYLDDTGEVVELLEDLSNAFGGNQCLEDLGAASGWESISCTEAPSERKGSYFERFG